jgi:hypothetical protein
MLRNHIHLSTAIGTTPEFAPTLRWVVTDRLEIPSVHMAIRMSLNGRVQRHILREGGSPVQLTDFKFTIKVKPEYGQTARQRLDALQGLNGQFASLVDLYHPEDGQSHVAYVRRVLVTVGEFAPIGPGLPFFLVDVTCQDARLT